MNLEKFYSTDIGINANHLYNTISKFKTSTFVDLGVRNGISSEIMLINSKENNNKVFGVDIDWSPLNPEVDSHPCYNKILGDSVTIGKYWEEKIDGLFIDTFHIKEQVLCELYFWYSHVKEGGFIAFHDSHWPEGKFDEYGGIKWGRVEEGIKDFFNISNLTYEDEFIKSEHYPESWGMTIVTIKKKTNYIEQYKKWDEVINKRNHLISLFWNESNKGNVKIDLTI